MRKLKENNNNKKKTWPKSYKKLRETYLQSDTS